jgi:hypothetical protein
MALTVLNFSSAQTVVPPGVTSDPNRGFAMQATIANPTAAAKTITINIVGAAPGRFPGFFEAKDYGYNGARKAFNCLSDPNTDNGLYYSDSANDMAMLTAPTFTCTGSLAAGQTSVITISSGSKIGSAGTSAAGTAWQMSVGLDATTPKVVGGAFS